LQQHHRAAAFHQRAQPALDLGVVAALFDLRLDDQGRGVRQHLHQGPVALGELRVGCEARAAEGAVDGAVTELDRHRDEAADPQSDRREPHRRREPGDVRDDRRQHVVDDRLAQRRLLPLRHAVEQRQRGLDDLQVLHRAVQAAQERQVQVQRSPGGPEQLRHLLRRLAALGH